MKMLNLGCSDDLKPGYLNVDQYEPPGATLENFARVDLTGQCFEPIRFMPPVPWPWADSSVDVIFAHDVFEHIDNLYYRGQKGIIWCLNEAHRVLKPGGALDLHVPCLPGPTPFLDPTHVSVWESDQRFYFDERWNNEAGERGRLGPAYGITALFKTRPCRSGPDWKPIAYAADAPERRKLMLILEAVK